MKKTFILSLIILSSYNSFSQTMDMCLNLDSTFSIEKGIGCDDYIEYAPLISDHTPIKNVRITIHVFQKSDGSENIFEPN